MDNSFYEYRREARITERKRREKEQNMTTYILIVQIVLALVITGVIYIATKGDTNLSRGLKEFYSTKVAREIDTSKIEDVFKKVAKTTFAPTYKIEITEEEFDFSSVLFSYEL